MNLFQSSRCLIFLTTHLLTDRLKTFSPLSIFFKSKINSSFSEAAPAYMQPIAAYVPLDIAAYPAPFCNISKLSFFWLIVLQKFLQLYGLGIQLLKHFFIVAISHSASPILTLKAFFIKSIASSFFIECLRSIFFLSNFLLFILNPGLSRVMHT